MNIRCAPTRFNIFVISGTDFRKPEQNQNNLAHQFIISFNLALFAPAQKSISIFYYLASIFLLHSKVNNTDSCFIWLVSNTTFACAPVCSPMFWWEPRLIVLHFKIFRDSICFTPSCRGECSPSDNLTWSAIFLFNIPRIQENTTEYEIGFLNIIACLIAMLKIKTTSADYCNILDTRIFNIILWDNGAHFIENAFEEKIAQIVWRLYARWLYR